MAAFSVTVPVHNIVLTSYAPKINAIGEGNLITFEQLIAIGGAGVLITLEQSVVLAGVGNLIDFEQSTQSPDVTGTLIYMQQTVKTGQGKFKGLLLS